MSKLWWVVVLMVLASCATKKTSSGDDLTRLVVTQTSSSDVLVIDLDGSNTVQSLPTGLPTPPISLPGYKSLIHPFGGAAYLTRAGDDNYRINLKSGQPVTPKSSTGGKSVLASAPKGDFFAVGDFLDDTVSIYNFFSGRLVSAIALPGRGIEGLAFCDSGRSILVANRAPGVDLTFFVSKLDVSANGVVTNPAQELSSKNYLKVIDCAPGSKFGAALDAQTNDVMTFSIGQNGLAQTDKINGLVNGPVNKNFGQDRPRFAQAIKFSPDAKSLYVRFSTGGTAFTQGWLEKLGVNTNNGKLTTTSYLKSSPHTTASFDAARISISPAGDVIYLPDTSNNSIMVISTANSGTVTNITDPKIIKPAFVSVGNVKCLDINGNGC